MAPAPDVMITSVGTEIHYGEDMTADVSWEHHINHQWQRDSGSGFQDIACRTCRIELPATAAVERKKVLPAGDEITAFLLQLVKRALQSVEHATEQARTKLHRQRALCGFDRLTDAESAVVFKNLDRGDTAFQANHLTGQPADTDKQPVADFQTRQVDAHCGAADTGDLAVHDWSLT